MANATLNPKGFTLTAGGAKVAEYNIHRKALFLGTSGTDVQFAIGEAPEDRDYAIVKGGDTLYFDSFCPVGAIWLKGTGTAIMGEVL